MRLLELHRTKGSCEMMFMILGVLVLIGIAAFIWLDLSEEPEPEAAETPTVYDAVDALEGRLTALRWSLNCGDLDMQEFTNGVDEAVAEFAKARAAIQ